MEISEKLIKFKSEVGENIAIFENNKNELSSDFNNFLTINTNVIENLGNSFKSDGGESAISQINFLNKTINGLSKEFDSKTGEMITKCKSLNEGITNLESIVSNYNSKVSELNRLEVEDPKRNSVKSEISKLENNFNVKHQEMCILHDNILGIDTSSSPSDEIKDNSLDNSFNAGFTGMDTSNCIFYEKDGIIYQKVIPQQTADGVNATYTIAYNKNAILNAVGQDSKIGQQAVAFLNAKVANNENGSALWKMFGKSYTKEEYADIASIMNIILENSYKVNNCKSVSDYATIAATVATNSLVHMKYDGARTSFTIGFDQVLPSGYDCIGFTTWAYYQGLSKVYNLGNNAKVGLSDVTCNGTYYYYGQKIEKMSNQERANITPGSIVTRYGHIGIVIGNTTKNGEPAVVIAHSAGTNQGTITGTWPVSNLTNQWEKVMTPEDMTRRAVEGDFNRNQKG